MHTMLIDQAAGIDFDTLRSRGLLAPAAKLEPLMGRWPLWPHLVPPAQYAMNLAYRMLPLMQSFLDNPEVHAAAAADPKLFGGPFVALTESDRPAVQELMDWLHARSDQLLAFAHDFKAFDEQLLTSADGYSLDAFYAQAPATLGGFVELLYDLNSHPKMRVFEELMYHSGLDDTGAQSFCLHACDDTQRPFFMSTPLLGSPHRVLLDVPYHHPLIDRLAAARLTPGIPEELLDILKAGNYAAQCVDRLFTIEPPVRVEPEYRGDGVRLRYFGHACVLVQANGVSILVDPATAWQRDDDLARLTFDDLPDFIDYVVISHCHQDHLVAETLIQLRSRIGTVVVPANDRGNIADPSMRLILERLGFARVTTLEHFQSVPFAGGEIVSLPFVGEHGGVDIASKHSILVRCEQRKILFMVDSDAVDARLSDKMAARVGPIDVLFLGMECSGAPMSWLYGPLLTRAMSRRNDQSRRFSGSDSDRGWSALQALQCRRVFVYAMGQEPWMRHLMGLEYTPDSPQLQQVKLFLERCEQAGIEAACLKGCREIHLD